MTTTAGNERRGAAHAVRAVLLHGAGTTLALLLLPVWLLLGAPLAAWAIAFGLVVANRLVHAAVAFGVRDASLTVVLGALGFSMIFRALLSALTLFFVGASVGGAGDQAIGFDRPDLARAAIVLFLICFTLDAGIESIRRAGQRDRLAADDPQPSLPATIRETTA